MSGRRAKRIGPLRAILLASVLVSAAVIGALLLSRPVRPVGGVGPAVTFDIEGFVGSQIAGIVNAHLRPTLSFETISYEPPGTVRLRGVSLVSAEGERFVHAEGLRVTLAEVPSRDRPLKIERIVVENGLVRVIGDGRGGFVGLTGIVKGRETDEPIGEEFRLSNVLVLRRVELRGVGIEYRRTEGDEPLRLDGIRADMDVSPVEEEGPGWYAIAFSSGRAPGLRLEVAGRVNLDSYDAEIARLNAAVDAGEQTRHTLPSPLAGLMERYEIDGALEASGSASINLRDPLAGRASLAIRGDGMRVALGEYRIPVETLAMDASFGARRLEVAPIAASLLAGTLRGDAAVEVGEANRPATVHWEAERLNLRDLLRAAPREGEPPRLAGRFSGSGEVRAELESPRATLSGSGEVTIEEGRLVMLPGLTQLGDLIGREDPDRASNHRGRALFTLGPTGITVTESEVVTNSIAARGTGLVGFDRSLDMIVNAGPIEMLQRKLGPLGSILGKLTDRLVKYAVTGTVDDPKVRMIPLGFD
jgi:hypothetical protein